MSRAARAQLDALLAEQAAEAEAARVGAALAHDMGRVADLPELPAGYSWGRILGSDLAEPLVAHAYWRGQPYLWTRTCWDNVVRRAKERHLLRLEGYARRAADARSREELFRDLAARLQRERKPLGPLESA